MKDIWVFFPKPWEAAWWMYRQADRCSDGLTQCLTWSWAQESHGSTSKIVNSIKCCSSIRVASVDENKNSHQNITITHTQTTCQNCIALHIVKKGVCPTEVGVLASVFENSATELKQKLLK